MGEGAPIPGIPGIKPDQPVPFFATVDFSARPTWENGVPIAKEILRIVGDEKENPGTVLASFMKSTYGEEALDLVDKIKPLLGKPLQRNRIHDPAEFQKAIDVLVTARGLMASPTNRERPDGWQYVGSSSLPSRNTGGMQHGTRKEPKGYGSGGRDINDQ